MAKNMINQAQAQGTTLGYAQTTANFSTSSNTAVQVTGVSVNVTIPAGGRRVRVTGYCNSPYVSSGSVPAWVVISIWDGPVGTGTDLCDAFVPFSSLNANNTLSPAVAIITPPAGAKTYNLGMKVQSGNTGLIGASASNPVWIHVELI